MLYLPLSQQFYYEKNHYGKDSSPCKHDTHVQGCLRLTPPVHIHTQRGGDPAQRNWKIERRL